MRFHPLVAAIVGIVVMASIPALIKDHGYSGGQYGKPHSQQREAAPPAPLVNPPATQSAGQGAPCPGTDQSEYDCNTVSAIANVRQARAAERFNWLAVFEIFVALVTAFVAGFAARFAKNAADAGTKSYKAFVAAEDALLVLDFDGGLSGSSTTADGVTTDYFLFHMELSNEGRSAARLHQLFIVTNEGSSARPLAKTLKVGASVEIADRLYINADNGKATVSILYATALHPETKMDFIIALDAVYPKKKATAYVERTRIGRPKAK